ncbi:MAG TPA: XRE family transcriptional regulator [Gemmatimonadaceae bacterium]|nr:XRE family transcriptional regulator [Gemmatimonadaceae bacterium]
MPKRATKRSTAPALVSKSVIAKEIARIIDDRGWTQTEASFAIHEAPSQISLMVTGKLRGFSLERLLRTLTALGRDVEIRVMKAKRNPGKVRLNVK